MFQTLKLHNFSTMFLVEPIFIPKTMKKVESSRNHLIYRLMYYMKCGIKLLRNHDFCFRMSNFTRNVPEQIESVLQVRS